MLIRLKEALINEMTECEGVYGRRCQIEERVLSVCWATFLWTGIEEDIQVA